jgi:vancomycin resistance protein YoaR
MSKNKSKKIEEYKTATQAVNVAAGVGDQKEKKMKKWHKILIAVFLSISIPSGTIFAFEEIFRKRIYPGISSGGLDLGGKTKIQALEILNNATRKFNEEGLIFFYQNKKAAVMPIVAATSDPDLSRTAFTLENEKTVEAAFALGRGGDLFDNLKNQLTTAFWGINLNLFYQANNEEIKKILRENFGLLEKPPKNAELKIFFEEGTLRAEILPEESGQVFDYDRAINSAFLKLANLENTPTSLDFISAKPKIKKTETAAAVNRALKLAKLCPIALGEGKKNWIISQDQIREWLELQMAPVGINIGLNQEKINEYFTAITKEINSPPQNAKFKIENGIVKEFQLHQGGKELNLEASYQAINNYLQNIDTEKIPENCPRNPSTEETVQLVVTITAPQIPIGSLNNLGIKELVGVGESDFSGSPVNRRHNIKTGAIKLNGTLIAPGEEFSTNKALGDISGATGYLPELVIKGDKTIPEYGGGLCQIGTTMFRVALNAGLPITERRPHSYRVVYYEPAGMDATIYSPKPDFKFINDTPAYLLLQTRIEGDIVTFELWGTSDGRKTELTKPKIYNIVGSGPTKIIETEDLKPGEKKCTERAHTGADAEFSRTITTAAGEIKTETWNSHYVPWSAVCLVGKEQSAAPAPETPAPPADGSSPLPPDPALQNTNSGTSF